MHIKDRRQIIKEIGDRILILRYYSSLHACHASPLSGYSHFILFYFIFSINYITRMTTINLGLVVNSGLH